MANRKVSFSQYQMWKVCPHRWKLNYIDKHYTGKGLPIEIKFIDRSHGWSTTKYKTSISNSLKN